ncbi:luciferase-like protein [Dictyobacter alpinus]|uniref:Luciferase-like protein n=1 Tax=Dictyobacter alpinus TaxID=2014873 RepID=A0A402BBV8_9CHLR|nr:LLM class flavin-dependent oxidoreductase [Dictyobacter alpinus]GCE28819.1 luciferase-like protein [Dictyobacter alpinus]
MMKFAINTPNFGSFSDARLMAELAHEAEEAGWDGFFVWDHIGGGTATAQPMADPWIVLTAMALATKRIKLAPLVTPLPRRRPWKLARECTTLDHLSNGRLILGVGIGSDEFFKEFSSYGEPTEDKLHGEMLDEALDVLALLWSGETVNYSGKHYQLNDAVHLPKPQQQPRIPIWVAGVWPAKKPFQRAARWDGVAPLARQFHSMSPAEIREVSTTIQYYRESDAPFDILANGKTSGTDHQKDLDQVQPYIDAGATWWQEDVGAGSSQDLAAIRQRIHLGPPTR